MIGNLYGRPELHSLAEVLTADSFGMGNEERSAVRTVPPADA